MSRDTRPVGPDVADDSTAEVDLEWLTLDDGEEVLWASTPHKSSLLPALAVGIPLSFVLIGIPIVVVAYLSFTNTNYVVTTRGLYRKRGILSRDVKQIGFDKVQNISYSQSPIGSSLGYGTVEISTAGSSGVELRFRSIPTPAEIQELISREIERREDGSRDQEGDVDDTLDAILTELRGIRQALDGEATGSQPDAPADAGADASADAGADTTADAGVDAPTDGEPADSETAGADPFEPAVTESTDDR
ncbi:PH domain-containing protein [Halohasta salina]|uniref:PH domain-containing protein n=1 Tax=Halohasta salina TaxID=2961621 RepID=UPI0020A3BFA4|nr:PH domain-containing protein [Halohasta salina]